MAKIKTVGPGNSTENKRHLIVAGKAIGKKRGPKTEALKEHIIGFRLSALQYSVLFDLAKKMGMSVHEWCRREIINKIFTPKSKG